MASSRRSFLTGMGGSMLALPLLESLMPRRAFADPVAPKRFILFRHNHGRVVGNGLTEGGVLQDLWSPRTTTGAIPAGVSPLLAPLDGVRGEIVTIDGIDNVLRHAGSGQSAVDGHHFPALTGLTCVLPRSDGGGGGPSIDYVVGDRLRPNTAMAASIIVNADSGNCSLSENFWGQNGTPPTYANPCGDPADAIRMLFQNVSPSGPPPAPTLADRLHNKRRSALDRVLADLDALKAKVSVRDRARLDQHATFIRGLETRLQAGNMSTPTQGCQPLDPASVPARASEYSYSAANDDISVPIIVESVVQSLACDVTRSIGFDFGSDVATFDWLYPSGSPFLGTNWHATIHNAPRIRESAVPTLQPTIQFFASTFAALVQRLAQVTDVDGARMLDNTLLLWVSDLGYGPTHACFNIPVVMAGMRSAFARGQGRHLVVQNRASLGDLYAQVLRMFGGTDLSFGATGTLATIVGSRNHPENCGENFCAQMGYPSYIGPDTPLHSGPLDL